MHNIKIQYLAIGAIAFAALISGSIFFFSRHAQSLNTVAVARGDIAHLISANGIVAANQDVSLTFDLQGKVSAVYADVGSTTHKGDIIAALDTSQVMAGIAGAQADVDAAQAQLTKAENGARPEEKAIYAQKYLDATTVLASAMRNAYLQTEDAIVNKSDAVFTNGDTSNPSINIRTQSSIEQSSINQQRLDMKNKLAVWKDSLATLSAALSAGGPATSTSVQTALNAARATTSQSLDASKAYLANLSAIVNNVTVGNSGIPQQTISAYTALINGASQEVTGASTAEQTVDATWSSSRDALALENAGAQSEDIASLAAVLAKAQAGLQSYQSQLHHSYIIAPFDGIITAMNVKIGEVYVPGISAGADVKMMSSGGFKIETYVPETNIGSLAVGQNATITFDAFGAGVSFPATVSLIDPAPVVQGGANAYKVTLHVLDDSKLKPGLSANISISAEQKAGVLIIPKSSIMTRDGKTFVLMQGSGSFVERSVQIGISGAVAGHDGQYTEVISGVAENDLVAAFGATSSSIQ